MLCLAFAKKGRIEDQIMTQESNQNMSMCICRLHCWPLPHVLRRSLH